MGVSWRKRARTALTAAWGWLGHFSLLHWIMGSSATGGAVVTGLFGPVNWIGAVLAGIAAGFLTYLAAVVYRNIFRAPPLPAKIGVVLSKDDQGAKTDAAIPRYSIAKKAELRKAIMGCRKMVQRYLDSHGTAIAYRAGGDFQMFAIKSDAFNEIRGHLSGDYLKDFDSPVTFVSDSPTPVMARQLLDELGRIEREYSL